MNVPICPNCSQHGSDVPKGNIIQHTSAHVVTHKDLGTNYLYRDYVPEHVVWKCIRCDELVGAYRA